MPILVAVDTVLSRADLLPVLPSRKCIETVQCDECCERVRNLLGAV